MSHRIPLHRGIFPAVALLCLMLAACSTTQKTDSGAGSQDAAPISEAGQTDQGAAASSSGGAAGTSSGTSTSPSDEAATTAGVQQGAAQGTPLAGDEEAVRLKEQLAQQDAEINRVREEQLEAQRLADEKSAQERGEAAATAGTETPSAAGAPGAATEQPSASSQSAAAQASSASAANEPLPSFPDQPSAAEPLQRSVYFSYDATTIDEQYDSMLVGHAAYLKQHPDIKAEVQGNCDERGSREYNLALGARRAEAVKRALELAGADGNRIKTVSYGAEKPVAFGKDEESYKQNRRADIAY